NVCFLDSTAACLLLRDWIPDIGSPTQIRQSHRLPFSGVRMTTPLRVLLIEDSEDDAALVVRELSRAGYDIVPERIDTAETLAAALERERGDVAIADYTMPRFSGTAALALLREYDAELPFIFVSGTIGEDAAVAAMKAGAHDYIMKG